MTPNEQADQLELAAKILREGLEWEYKIPCEPEWRPSHEGSSIAYYLHCDGEIRLKTWTPPEPPEGMVWHKPEKACWEDGWRCMLIGEVNTDQDCYFHWGKWHQSEPNGMPIESSDPIYRTRRPLPTTPKLVPLELADIHPGDRFRMKGDVYGWWVPICVRQAGISVFGFNGVVTYSDLQSAWQRLPFGKTEWEACEKEVQL